MWHKQNFKLQISRFPGPDGYQSGNALIAKIGGRREKTVGLSWGGGEVRWPVVKTSAERDSGRKSLASLKFSVDPTSFFLFFLLFLLPFLSLCGVGKPKPANAPLSWFSLLSSFASSLLLTQLRGRGYSIRALVEGNRKNVAVNSAEGNLGGERERFCYQNRKRRNTKEREKAKKWLIEGG